MARYPSALIPGSALLGALLIVVYTPPALALPSFARQTGQPCGTCHTDYAGLTPYGRRFKIEGYTAGGGAYQPTLFPSSDDTHDQKHWVPPISMMNDRRLYQHAGAAAAAHRAL